MQPAQVRTLVDAALVGIHFENFHGITADNVRRMLIEPFLVEIELDDDNDSRQAMWIVLQEMASPQTGHVIVFAPDDGTWGVAEHVAGRGYLLVVGTASLAHALDSM